MKSQEGQVIHAGDEPVDPNWGDVMSYFRNNPAALLDAIPTPREERRAESRNMVFGKEPSTPMKSTRSL
jgi:hypothetical protein